MPDTVLDRYSTARVHPRQIWKFKNWYKLGHFEYRHKFILYFIEMCSYYIHVRMGKFVDSAKKNVQQDKFARWI